MGVSVKHHTPVTLALLKGPEWAAQKLEILKKKKSIGKNYLILTGSNNIKSRESYCNN